MQPSAVQTVQKVNRVRSLVWALVWLGVGAAVLAAVLNSEQTPQTLLQVFATRFRGIFIEAAPFLLMGTLVSGFIDAFVKPEHIARFVPRNPVLATVSGGFLGFLFPVCECGVVPVVRRLYGKGLPLWVGVTFLLAAPVMNPVVLVSTASAFGVGPVLVGRFVLTFIIAVSVGLVFALGARRQPVLQPQTLAPVMGGSGEAAPPQQTLAQGLRHALQSASGEFFDMGRYLIIGTALAAAMQTFISQEALLELGRGPVVSVITMQALAFLLSVCSTVDAFLALAFVGTFTTGSIITFLTFGPMVDIKSMLMFLGVFQRRTVLYLILLPLLMSALAGIWLNLNVAF